MSYSALLLIFSRLNTIQLCFSYTFMYIIIPLLIIAIGTFWGEIVKVESALSALCFFCPIRLLLVEFDPESLAIDFDALAVDISFAD